MTVGTHPYHIFLTIGVTARVDLRTALDAGIPTPA
jgi:hypothetical protein